MIATRSRPAAAATSRPASTELPPSVPRTTAALTTSRRVNDTEDPERSLIVGYRIQRTDAVARDRRVRAVNTRRRSVEHRVSRRGLIKYGLGATAAVAVPELLESGWRAAPAAAARAVGLRELRSPRVLQSHNGKLKLKLVC